MARARHRWEGLRVEYRLGEPLVCVCMHYEAHHTCTSNGQCRLCVCPEFLALNPELYPSREQMRYRKRPKPRQVKASWAEPLQLPAPPPKKGRKKKMQPHVLTKAEQEALDARPVKKPKKKRAKRGADWVPEFEVFAGAEGEGGKVERDVHDTELHMLTACIDILKKLEPEQAARVTRYLLARFGP